MKKAASELVKGDKITVNNKICTVVSVFTGPTYGCGIETRITLDRAPYLSRNTSFPAHFQVEVAL